MTPRIGPIPEGEKPFSIEKRVRRIGKKRPADHLPGASNKVTQATEKPRGPEPGHQGMALFTLSAESSVGHAAPSGMVAWQLATSSGMLGSESRSSDRVTKV